MEQGRPEYSTKTPARSLRVSALNSASPDFPRERLWPIFARCSFFSLKELLLITYPIDGCAETRATPM